MGKKAVADAVHKGEQRALQIEKKMKDINAKTRAAMNNRITTEIGTLSKSIHSQIDELNLQTKEARAQMKAEILFAIKSAAALAKHNQNLQNEAKLSAGERAAMAETVAKDKAHAQAQIENAVAAQNKALSALTQETESSIKKTNKALTAQVDIMIKNNDKVRDEMKANTAALVASLEAARKSADEQLASVNAASAARYDEVVKAVEDGIESARVKADARFTGVYDTMLKDRKKYDEKVAGAVAELNDSIAKNSAIEDARFAKTVKDIDAARKEARSQV